MIRSRLSGALRQRDADDLRPPPRGRLAQRAQKSGRRNKPVGGFLNGHLSVK
jgi:hypothetical protein